MSYALNLKIKLLSPAVNGSNDFAFKNLNTTFRPVFADPEKTLNIMFTHTGIPAKYSENMNRTKY
ncbi:hypothetical protein DPMN_068487 [Dreissena polymorpha]|uniref:Uncharacterized protein n=1 Tax=Dreissena polymorpha TaxID=45954 RepID=A0A9D3YZA1_DREPO|nr:hypothetical protein DPMN_068487 [Dreissena polymorpha]